MNRRRELVLQRVSRIGSLTAAESVSQNTKWKGRPTGMLTIEAAIGAYMKKDTDVYNLHRQQDAYIPVSKDPGQQEMSNQSWKRSIPHSSSMRKRLKKCWKMTQVRSTSFVCMERMSI